MNVNKEKIKKESYDFTESDIKKAYRPIRVSGWTSIIFSLLIIVGMLIGGYYIDIRIGLLKFLPLLLVILIPALFYFSGLRDICRELDYENGFSVYKKRVKISIKIMTIIPVLLLIIFLFRILPPDNKVDELIIANAQIINFPYFDTLEENDKYFIAVRYNDLKIECSKDVYSSIDPKAPDIKEFGYKINYRWSIWHPNRCKLLRIEKIKV